MSTATIWYKSCDNYLKPVQPHSFDSYSWFAMIEIRAELNILMTSGFFHSRHVRGPGGQKKLKLLNGGDDCKNLNIMKSCHPGSFITWN